MEEDQESGDRCPTNSLTPAEVGGGVSWQQEEDLARNRGLQAESAVTDASGPLGAGLSYYCCYVGSLAGSRVTFIRPWVSSVSKGW